MYFLEKLHTAVLSPTSFSLQYPTLIIVHLMDKLIKSVAEYF